MNKWIRDHKHGKEWLWEGISRNGSFQEISELNLLTGVKEKGAKRTKRNLDRDREVKGKSLY